MELRIGSSYSCEVLNSQKTSFQQKSHRTKSGLQCVCVCEWVGGSVGACVLACVEAYIS